MKLPKYSRRPTVVVGADFDAEDSSSAIFEVWDDVVDLERVFVDYLTAETDALASRSPPILITKLSKISGRESDSPVQDRVKVIFRKTRKTKVSVEKLQMKVEGQRFVNATDAFEAEYSLFQIVT